MLGVFERGCIFNVVEHDIKRIIGIIKDAVCVVLTLCKRRGLRCLTVVYAEALRLAEHIAYADQNAVFRGQFAQTRNEPIRHCAKSVRLEQSDDGTFLIQLGHIWQKSRNTGHQHVVEKLALAEKARLEYGGKHMGREAQIGDADTLHRFLLAGTFDNVSQYILVHIESIGAVAPGTEQGVEHSFCDQRHEPVAELREFPCVIAHKSIGDYLAVVYYSDGFDKQLQPVAEKDERLRGNAHVVLNTIVLCMGGINASVFIVLMYPIALTIFAHCDIPKRFILGVLGACSYTFTLTMPGSPQVTNVAAMSALGTSAGVAAVPGLIGAAVEIVVIIVLLNIFINKARARGEHFELHPLDPHYDENSPRPKFIVSILPLIVLFILFNVVGVDINICIIISVVISIALFWKQLKGNSIRELLSTGAAESIHMSMTVAAICGFAGVVTNTEAFTSMLNAIVSIDISPMLICAIVVAVMCMLTGGSSTGQLISLPLIAPKLMELGLSVGAIHRIGCFAATTLDSLPYSGAILMLLPLCRMKLREVYPPLFITTVIATTCGTAAVIITCALFPGLT